MILLARFPRIMAWIVVLVVLGTATLGALQGLHVLEPDMPVPMAHIHGIIVAVKAGEVFAVRVPGHAGVLWFHAAPDAPLSFAHLLRHLHEHASTDIYYEGQRQGLPLAWIAD